MKPVELFKMPLKYTPLKNSFETPLKPLEMPETSKKVVENPLKLFKALETLPP